MNDMKNSLPFLNLRVKVSDRFPVTTVQESLVTLARSNHFLCGLK